MRLLNQAGAVLKRAGGCWPRLEVKALLHAAERRTGLSDWGDTGFQAGLEAFLRAFAERDNLHTFGRFYVQESCIRLLAGRLRIQDELTRHPEILQVPVSRPLFVTGLPRSGTTLMHRLLSLDPAGRPLLFWEALEPAPAPRPETHRTDRRILRVQKSVALLRRLAPQMAAAHLYEAETPEEDNNLFAHGFAAGMLGFMFDVPDYVKWLQQQDLLSGYEYLRNQIQLLSWHFPRRTWVLKSPAHLFGLDSLLAVFPDARVVVLHRDPAQVMPSLCSLASSFRAIVSDKVDPSRLGAEMTEAMAVGADRAVTVRGSTDPDRFCDLSYPDLVHDPIAAARSVYCRFHDSFTTETEGRMRQWLSENPQHKHGVHRYSLEQFGLETDQIHARFARYYEWMAEHALLSSKP
jgi:hypothetical protein